MDLPHERIEDWRAVVVGGGDFAYHIVGNDVACCSPTVDIPSADATVPTARIRFLPPVYPVPNTNTQVLKKIIRDRQTTC